MCTDEPTTILQMRNEAQGFVILALTALATSTIDCPFVLSLTVRNPDNGTGKDGMAGKPLLQESVSTYLEIITLLASVDDLKSSMIIQCRC